MTSIKYIYKTCYTRNIVLSHKEENNYASIYNKIKSKVLKLV